MVIVASRNMELAHISMLELPAHQIIGLKALYNFLRKNGRITTKKTRIVKEWEFIGVHIAAKVSQIMRKKGKKHSTLTVLPNGMRRDTKWELPIRAALLALDTGKLTEQQCIDLFVLAEMSQRTGAKGHYLEHSKTLHRLICDIGDRVVIQ